MQGSFAPSALIGYAIAAVSLILFIYRELQTYAPLMDLRVFANPGFSTASFAAMIVLLPVVGVRFLLALFLGSAKNQELLGIPANVALAIGLVLAAIGTFFIAQADATTADINVVWRLMIFGVASILGSRN